MDLLIAGKAFELADAAPSTPADAWPDDVERIKFVWWHSKNHACYTRYWNQDMGQMMLKFFHVARHGDPEQRRLRVLAAAVTAAKWHADHPAPAGAREQGSGAKRDSISSADADDEPAAKSQRVEESA